MPEIRDRARLRALLEADRVWGLYPLGDLEPQQWPHTRWWANDDALVLLYRRFGVPVLVTFGPALAVRPLLDEMSPEPMLYLHVRPEILPLLREHHEVALSKRMVRMSIAADAALPQIDARVTRLSGADLAEVEALYGDGVARGEEPAFFAPEMLGDGVYCGIRGDGALVAVAGTHVVAPTARAAAVGNVYTRLDYRGRGLAAATTSAVVAALASSGIRIIGLSVAASNVAARRVYEKLGFRAHCTFVEGLAQRR